MTVYIMEMPSGIARHLEELIKDELVAHETSVCLICRQALNVLGEQTRYSVPPSAARQVPTG